MSSPAIYQPRRPSRSEFLVVRGLTYHLQCWGEPSLVTPETPALVLLHGWMDVGASFQFLVDELAAQGLTDRYIIAPDWRGFGLTYERSRHQATPDTYWFPDYLADLDVILSQHLGPAGSCVDLLGHSMGGNVAMLYAGVRHERIRRLAILEGFGMPDRPASMAPQRYLHWLEELENPASLNSYDDRDAVARRLQRNNPLLPADKAHWIAGHWAGLAEDGRWHLRADPAHKQSAPTMYRADEVMAVWQRISAPLLFVDGDRSDMRVFWGDRYPREEFERRLAVVPTGVTRRTASPSGHMIHHDQPGQVARWLDGFLSGGSVPA